MTLKKEYIGVQMHFSYQSLVDNDEMSIEEQGFMMGYKKAFKQETENVIY